MSLLDAARPGMNPDIRPQDDLFAHVNGRWLATTQIPEDRGRYGTFDVLRETAPGRGGEIQLTDALATLVARGEPVHGVVFSGRRYDTGDKLDYLKAVIRLAVERDDLGPALRTWLHEFVTELPAEGASSS